MSIAKKPARNETSRKQQATPSRVDFLISRFHVHEAQSQDWLFFVCVAVVAVLVHACSTYFTSSTTFHMKYLAFWFSLAILYLFVVSERRGPEQALMWATGYMLELTNMIENTFIFHSMARALKVPEAQCRRVMLIAMCSQIFFATVGYMGVAQYLRQARVLPYLLGAWLVYTSSLLVATTDKDEEVDLSNSWAGMYFRWCLGDRFWPAYDGANLFVRKQDKTMISLLGFVVFGFAFMACLLETDVTLTKIAQFQSTYINFSSTVVALLVMPDFSHFAGQLFEKFWTLKYGIAAITGYFGIQFLLIDVIAITSAVNMVVMLSIVLACMALSPILGTASCVLPSADEEGAPQLGNSFAPPSLSR
jgi:tellurite resistance protein TerC